MSARDPSDTSPEAARFPRPRAPEAPSPYRERVAPAADTPPTESGRLVVSRPEPPAAEPPRRRPFSGDLGLSAPSHHAPIPAGVLDEIRRKLAPIATFAGNHPHLLLLIAVGLLCLVLSVCGRNSLNPYPGFSAD